MITPFSRPDKQINRLLSFNLNHALQVVCAVGMAFIYSCKSSAPPSDTLFTLLPASETGLHFINKNDDTDTLSIIDYLYYYNGGGVAVGDINNDGLPDIYFTANTGGNTLYLNKGNFQFEDITVAAGVKGNADWSTGVTMADVNGDGYLDIYVSTVSKHDPHLKNVPPHVYFNHSVNQLFINNKNNSFTESAAQWGLDLQGYNTQAVFFDYDKDGDLDLFQLQHSTHQPDAYGPVTLRDKYSDVSGGKLFRNDGNKFINVTKESGIISSALGYGLGVAVADVNHDGYDDIYVSNDFHENDYYYINQGNGSFKEINKEAFGHISTFSMGNDIADVNNDGWPDIFTADMLPADEKVLKSSLGDGPLDTYLYQRSFGYSYQYARNCLQLNIAEGERFADIGLYSGVAATDWSWAPLVADYNLDGYADLFVSNGIKKRPNDLDYIKFISALPQNKPKDDPRAFDKQILANLPAGEWHNYMFEGNPDLKFKDQSLQWGFEKAGLSQGAIYADLDGDGDLDLVTNNMNEAAGVYKNNSREKLPQHHFLSVQLNGKAPNAFAVGAKVFLFAEGLLHYKQLQPVKGFMSSGETKLNFGLGKAAKLDSLLVLWPDNHLQTLRNVPVDTLLKINYEANGQPVDQRNFIRQLLQKKQPSDFSDITAISGIAFTHKEDSYFDFNDQWFIPHAQSTQGPKTTVGDVNGDGMDDFFVCGAKDQPGVLFLQQGDGRFKASADSAAFVANKACEDVNALFFDADKDGDLDLHVVSGGNVYTGVTELLHDRLYINNGKGVFALSKDALPATNENKSVAVVADVDHDGDLDVFVGGKSYSRNYSKTPSSYLLINDSKGHFSIANTNIISGLDSLGIVSDASWIDVDKDGWQDLIVVGEWLQPVLFKNDKGLLKRQNLTANDDALTGWWSAIKVADINGDGYEDVLLGNFGENSKIKASAAFPLKMYSIDFYKTGREHQVMAIEKDKKYYPFLNKEDLENQLPYLKKEFLKYGEMAGKTVEEIFKEKLDDAKLFTAATFSSVLLLNDGKGGYTVSELPGAAQWSPVFTFAVDDFNNDGKADFVSGGNFYGIRPYEGRYDAAALNLFYGAGKNAFQTILPLQPSLAHISGEIRDVRSIRLGNNKKGLLVAVSNGPLRLLSYE